MSATESPDVFVIEPAPTWMTDFLKRLMIASHYLGPVRLGVVAPDAMPALSGITPNPEAFTVIHADGGATIVMPNTAVTATDNWRMLLAHEFAHVLHSRLDILFVGPDAHPPIREDYLKAVEQMIEYIVLPLTVAAMIGAEFVPDDPLLRRDVILRDTVTPVDTNLCPQ